MHQRAGESLHALLRAGGKTLCARPGVEARAAAAHRAAAQLLGEGGVALPDLEEAPGGLHRDEGGRNPPLNERSHRRQPAERGRDGLCLSCTTCNGVLVVVLR